MTWIKRIGFFLLTNFLVIATIGILMKVFNIQPYLDQNGINYGSLMAFCFLYGMAGSFISLAMSRFAAKSFMGVKLVNENDPQAGWVVRSVYQYAKAAGLSKMPEVGVYHSPEVNAFATGPTKSRSLVAVSAGLLNNMSQEEAQGVLAHEVAHIENGDMVTMTLIQGVINAFALFLAYLASFAISNLLRGDRNNGRSNGWMEYIIRQIFFMIFSFLGMFVVAGFSRWREFRADAGGARLAGKTKMIAALERLQSTIKMVDESKISVASMKISSKGGIMSLLATHPPLEKRIEALKKSL